MEADFSNPNPHQVFSFKSDEALNSYHGATGSFAMSASEGEDDPEFFLACCDWEAAVEQERAEEREEKLFAQNLQAISDKQMSVATIISKRKCK